jgi:hypothetical protein
LLFSGDTDRQQSIIEILLTNRRNERSLSRWQRRKRVIAVHVSSEEDFVAGSWFIDIAGPVMASTREYPKYSGLVPPSIQQFR